MALLNAAGEVVVSAGAPMDYGTDGMPQSGVHWGMPLVTIVNLVDLGADLQSDGTNSPPTIILPEPERGRDNRPRFPPPGSRPRPLETTNLSNPPPMSTNAAGRPDGDRHDNFRPGFRRPSWMTEPEYKALIAEKGLHGLVLGISADAYWTASTQDIWLRAMISGFAAVSVIGFGLAWRNLVRSSEFQMRLVRASELNSHLREMNVAAAGLAHETRNPLNIIRGLAQMISKAPEVPEAIRKNSCEITDEVDRVTVQLNEFINYSKPREVRRSPVVLGSVISDVVRALKSDLEDKTIKLERIEEDLTINADQQLLRQALFNLLMNAIQAVDPQGQIQIVTCKSNPQEACFEIRDNGPGVPVEQRKEIFRPYFTTRQQGTGLGLAVVQQIVMAHGWEVEYRPQTERGAVFRVSRLELVASH